MHVRLLNTKYNYKHFHFMKKWVPYYILKYKNMFIEKEKNHRLVTLFFYSIQLLTYLTRMNKC